jgi:hypothetical protein
VTDLLDLNQLALVGLVALALALAVGLLKYLLRAGLLSRLSAAGSERTVLALLHQVFLLALPVLVLGLLSYMLAHLLAPHLGRLDGVELLVFTTLLVGAFLYSLRLIVHYYAALPRTENGAADGGDKAKTARDDPLLPWLVDRDDQKGLLGEALRAYGQQYSSGMERPPLLCLIHGKREEHNRFDEHLLYYLREESRLDKFNQPHYRKLRLGSVGLRNAESLRAALQGALEDEEDFRKKLRNGRQAVVVHGDLDADKFRSLTDWLPTLAAFWLNYRANVPCLVLLSIRHDTKDAALAVSLGKHTPAPDAPAFTAYNGLPLLVLPELQGIAHAHVDTWAGEYKSTIRGTYCTDTEELVQKMQSWYKTEAQASTVPMFCLGMELRKLLQTPA